MANWFSIYVFIIAIFVLGVSLLNVYYYNRIRNGTCNAVTKKEAETGFWLNIFIAIFTAILFIWAIFNALSKPKDIIVEIQESDTKRIGPVPKSAASKPSSTRLVSKSINFPGT